MKFSKVALLLSATLSSTELISCSEAKLKRGRTKTQENPKNRQRFLKKEGEEKSEKKTSKKAAPPTILGTCDTCATHLPGYAFWGDDYTTEELFYEEGLFRFLEGENSDSLLPFNICYSTVPAAIFCTVLTLVSELIYKSDTLRCLMTSLSKTTRDTLCFLADLEGVPNPDVPAQPILFEGTRKLHEDPRFQRLLEQQQKLSPSQKPDGLSTFMAMATKSSGGMSSYIDPLNILGLFLKFIIYEAIDIVCPYDLKDDWPSQCYKYKKMSYGEPPSRKLQEFDDTIRPDGDIVGDGIGAFAGIIDDIADSDEAFDVLTGLLGAGFFAKCLDAFGGFGIFYCPIVFTFQKTQDAIICGYEKACNIEEQCDANQQFKTEYNSRRLAQQIPDIASLVDDGDFGDGIGNFLLGDILAPCAPCESECAAFCWYHDNFDSCDAYKRSWLFFDAQGAPPQVNVEFNLGQVPLLLGEALGL